MPRKRRLREYGIPDHPQPIDWFERELDKLIRGSRKAASQYLTEPDPLAVRDRVKDIVGRSRIMLAQVRTRPEIVYALWNARMLGFQYGKLYFHHNWGKDLIAAKRQRDGALRGSSLSRDTRKQLAQDRARTVVLEARRYARLRRRKVSQRRFALMIALRLNETEPPPNPLYTANSVRSILLSQHFFELVEKESG